MTAAASEHQVQRGIALLIGATACFAALDSTAKFISAGVSFVVAIWFRSLFQAFATGLAMVPRRGWRALVHTRHPRLHALRGAMLALSSGMAFLSLKHLPVAEFTAIIMLTPLIITVMAATSLGERVSVVRWMLVVGGFAGAIVVIRPGSDDFSWAMLMPLTLVGLNAGFQVLTRKLVQIDDAATMHFWSGSVGLGLTSLFLPFAGPLPDSAVLWWLLLLTGLLGSVGHYLLILAYSRASVATLAPFLYAQIGFATLAGWLVFAQAPDRWSVLGIALIAVCGVAGTRLAGSGR